MWSPAKGMARLRTGEQPAFVDSKRSISRPGCRNLLSAFRIYLSMNVLKTAFLLTLMTLLALFVGNYFGGQRGMLYAFIFAAVMNFVSYFFSDKIALAAYRAQPVTREQLPRVYDVVERLAQVMSIPMPKIFVIPADSPNAFATGRNPLHASLAVTQAMLNLMDNDELE